jgi:NAD(P)H-dependent FMN reductase
MEEPIRIAVIYGSTRKGRFCDKVVAWVAEQIQGTANYAIDLIDPAHVLPGNEPNAPPGKANLWQRMGAADAFVVVTPEYNHGYTAALKSLIDSVGAEWQAVEQLRLVFAELHAVTIRDSVSFAGAWEQFDESGRLHQPERAGRSMATMLGRLHWWAVALRNARGVMPYVSAL